MASIRLLIGVWRYIRLALTLKLRCLNDVENKGTHISDYAVLTFCKYVDELVGGGDIISIIQM